MTDGDEVVAELRPARRQDTADGPLEATMQRLAMRGAVTRVSEPKAGWSWSPPHLDLPVDTVSDLLDLRGRP